MEPEFRVTVDFKNDFDMKDLSPSSHSELAERFLEDDDIA